DPQRHFPGREILDLDTERAAPRHAERDQAAGMRDIEAQTRRFDMLTGNLGAAMTVFREYPGSRLDGRITRERGAHQCPGHQVSLAIVREIEASLLDALLLAQQPVKVGEQTFIENVLVVRQPDIYVRATSHASMSPEPTEGTPWASGRGEPCRNAQTG